MEAPQDKEKNDAPATDPHEGGTRHAGSGQTSAEVVPMQLDKDSLDAITKGVIQGLLQAEKDTATSPGGSGTHSAHGKEQGEWVWRRLSLRTECR